MKALITGIAGFAGSHLAENLLAHGYRVWGTALKGESLRSLKAIESEVNVTRATLDDTDILGRLISSYRPDVVFHLAALAAVGRSFDAPLETMHVNLVGTMKLYELLRARKKIQKIVFVSSADVFGPLPPEKMPIKPDYPLRPVSPYGASKAAADVVSSQYQRAFGLPIVRIRAFTHTGPRQQTGFAIPDFCTQIAAIEKRGRRAKGVIKVGDLSAERDLSDVRDIVDGYRLAAEHGTDGEAYILASGKADAVSNYLQVLLDSSKARIEVKVDKKLLRPVEVPRLVGSIARSRRQLGYKPKFDIKQTLSDTLDYWRRN